MHAAKIASPSPSLSPTFVSIYIYIFNVIVVNRSPSDPKRATYNRIVFIWDPWMLRSSEEDREGELGEFVVTRKKNASFRFLWREKGERGWRVWRLLTTTATTTTELDLNNEYISTFGRPEHFDTNPWRGRVMADVWGESFMTGICIYIYIHASCI